MMNQEKIQVIQSVMDGDKLLTYIQDIPAEREKKAFQNADIKKLAEKLSSDGELFDAIMGIYDMDKAYEVAIAAVPGSYTKEEFGEFRTVYANLFLKKFHDRVFSGKEELTNDELEQVAGGSPALIGLIGKGISFVVSKLPISDNAKKNAKLIVNTISGVATVAAGTVMCCTGVGAVAGGATVASGLVDIGLAIDGAATMNK